MAENHPNPPSETSPQDPALFDRVVTILEETRTHVARTVNYAMVVAYWLIGREIVEQEQKGAARATYGAELIKTLSVQLTEQYGNGFSAPNLRNFRQFYLIYNSRKPRIHYPLGSESKLEGGKKRYPLGSEFETGFHPDLSWSHYRALMRVENEEARRFYEVEAVKGNWSKRQLERQIHSLLFERLLKSRDKSGMMALANEGQTIQRPVDAIKDPYVLEFLDLPESHQLAESDLETALTTHLRDFLLELGEGFAFVARQKRLSLEGDHFYADLVFYHIRLKCYVVIDLKVDKLTHGDLGQMQMYVHYFDREIRTPEDNPTLGLILCTDKNDAMVEYVLDEGNERIFASRYQLELPSKEQLRHLLTEWRQEAEEESQ